MRSYLYFFVALIIAVSAENHPAFSQDRPSFGWPVRCEINKNCWFMNYVDMNPAIDIFADPFCHARGYDGHKGTDIAIASQAVMESGVDVLAAMDGTVLRFRDGEEDRFPDEADIQASKDAKKECGNAVLIDHGNALQTIYCHLKKGSVNVSIGDSVKKGDKIGEIGLSGVSEFPHLHFGITWEGAIMDPFTGQSSTQGCMVDPHQVKANPLWGNDISYTPTSLYQAGFFNGRPDLNAIDRGDQAFSTLSRYQDILTFWFVGFGVEQGDDITITITDPDGHIWAQHKTAQDKTRARQFYFTGKRMDDAPLKTGQYKGSALIERKKDGGLQSYKIERPLLVTE